MKESHATLTKLRHFVVIMVTVVLGATSIAADEPGADVSARYISMAIQGNLTGAQTMLELAERENAPEALSLLTRFRERFGANAVPDFSVPANPFVIRVMQAYQRYWNRGLLRKESESESEARLLSELSEAVLLRTRDDSPESVDPYQRLAQELRLDGIFAFTGASPPFRDLYLWKSQATERYEVSLTDRTVSLEVIFMDDVITQGWKEYASLGLASVTGWVEDGRLYCIRWAYDTESENFAVSYLKHEARHLADLEDFPDMDTTELEYRAKLTELAFAHQSLQRILRDFTDKAAANQSSPHAMANFRVVNDVYERVSGQILTPGADPAWRSIGAGDVNRAARELLAENSALHYRTARLTP